MRFDLTPRIAVLDGMDLPAGASIVVTDTLPGNAAEGFLINTTGSSVVFNTTVPGGQRSCNTVANANSTRTLTCTFTGPLTLAQINSTTIQIHGTSRSSGNFFNNASIGAAGEYVDSNSANNTVSLPYDVDAASDL